MTTTLKTYPKYKESSLEWTAGIPSDWEKRRFKFIFNLVKRPINIDDEIVTAFRDGTVTLRRNRKEDGFTIALKEIGYQGVRRGDLVISGMDGFAGAIGISDSDGKATPVYSICQPVQKSVFPSYYKYLLRVLALSGYISILARGIRERSTEFKWNIIGNLLLVVPDYETQKNIADFLDKKTRIIDEIIAKKEKLIKLLQEKRSALITRVVTKGLDPKAKMKSSGIDWLGEIPEGWIPKKIKYLISSNDGGVWGDIDDPNGTAVLRSTEVSVDGTWRINNDELAWRALSLSEIKSSLLIEGDLLMTKSSGSEEHIGKTAIVDTSVAKGCYCYSNFMQRIRSKIGVNPKLLYYFFNSSVSREQYKYFSTSTSGLGNLTATLIENLNFILIPEDEQQCIVDYLDNKINHINKTITKIESQIDQLDEYRSSLIYSAVTGKIKV